MINIYSSDGHTILAKVPITREAVHEEEMMTSNFVRLSWKAKVGGILPAGSYIQPFDDELDASGRPVKYYLFENYSPTAEKENRFTYTPQFEHPIMWLGKIPFIHLTGDTTTWDSATKNYEWAYTGPAGTIAREVVEYIERWCGRDATFASIFGTGWTSMPVGNLPSTATCSFNANDVLSAAATIANAFECEYHFDFENKVFYLGFMGQAQMQGSSTELKTGVNIGVANISKTKKEYYNRYVVLGGSKNLTQQTASGENVQLTTRLTLDEVQYPDSIIDLRGNNSFPDIMASANEPMMTGELVFDDIYPKIELYIYNPRERRCWLLDENKQKVEDPNGQLDPTDGKKYKTYSKWYVRLAYYTTSPISGKQSLNTETKDGVSYYWYEFEMSEELRVADTPLSMLFQANYDSNLSSALAGREFEVVWYDETPSEPEKGEDDIEAAGFQPREGDYRIEFDDSSGIIIPTTSAAGLCPYGNSAPSLQNNKVTLVNIVLDNTYKTMAQSELREAAVRKIQWLRSDLNTYSFNSNPLAFRLHNPHLYIGQSVIYDDGQDLNGSTSYRVATHVRKLVTRLDNPYIQEISVGNEKVKGNISSMKEQIEIIIAGGYGSGSGEGGGISEAQFLNLLRNYGSRLFLSKVKADSADGKITFLNGADFGSNGLWGYVREVLVNGETRIRAWFRNLYADYFEPTVMKVVEKILGPLSVAGNLFVTHDDQGRNGNLTVAEDITAGGTLRAANADIAGMLTTKNLTVTGLAHFFELIIDKIRAAGGAFIITPADGFEVEKVESITGGYRLYWTATDDSKNRYNTWHVGDQAICQTFNLANNVGGVYKNTGNKYYWSLVTNVSGENPAVITEYVYTRVITPTEAELLNELYYTESNGTYTKCTDSSLSDGKVYYTRSTESKEMHYIDISASDKVGTVSPEVGDNIAMLGHRIQSDDLDSLNRPTEAAKARQSAIYLTAFHSIDSGLTAPLLAFYKGIDDFNLSSHRGTYIDANGSKFIGQFESSTTGQNIEELLTGNEFNIIYGDGNPNTVTTPHMAWNYEANEYLAHVGWLYFDINLEPANADGGRLYRWSQVGSEVTGNFHGFYWVAVNDIDSLAALDKIADVASDGKLTGGAEKVRVYLEWLDAKKTTISLLAQASENGLGGSDDDNWDYVYKGTQGGSDAVTCGTAVMDVRNSFSLLSQYLNNKVAFISVVDPYTIPNGYPAWINPDVVAPATEAAIKQTTELPPWTENSNFVNMTGAQVYRKLWDDFYSSIVELTRALNGIQYKVIDEMGDDGLIDPEEKASLRQIFSSEVQRYFRMLDDFNSLGGVNARYDDDPTHTLSNIVLAHLNNLGTYLDGEQLDYMPTTVVRGDNPCLLCLFEDDYETGGYKPTEDTSVVSDKPYYKPEVDEITWEVNSEMREGLTDEMFYPATMESGDRTGYPRWLLKVSETRNQVVEDKEWDYFWNKYWSAANTMEANIALAKKYQIDHIEVDLPNTYYTTFNDTGHATPSATSNPPVLTPQLMPAASANPAVTFKVGDRWYEEAYVVNPITEELVNESDDGQQLYNVYVCHHSYSSDDSSAIYDNKKYYWQRIVEAVGTIRHSELGLIYDAVFKDTRFSYVKQTSDEIKSVVGAMVEGSKNLIINSDFHDGVTSHFGTAFTSPTLTKIESGGDFDLPTGFVSGVKFFTSGSSGSYISLLYGSSSNNQPYLNLVSGRSYTFSFYAKAVDTTSTIKVIYKRPDGTSQSPSSTAGSYTTFTLAPNGGWQRKTWTFTAKSFGCNICIGTTSPGNVLFTGLQLEEGSTATVWKEGSGKLIDLQSQIIQTASEIALAVKYNEALRAGIDIAYNESTDSGTVTLYGDKVKIQGDLDLSSMNGLGEVKINGDKLTIENDLDVKGLTTESVSEFNFDINYPIVINMGVLSDESTGTKVKSVFVKPRDASAPQSGDESFQLGACQMVVLPFYDAFVGNESSSNWWGHKTNGVRDRTVETWNTSSPTSKIYGSFLLYSDTSKDDSLRRIVPWKQSGTKVTITNGVNYYARNWQGLSAYSGDNQKKWANWLVQRAILVCSDARIVSENNITYTNTTYPYIGTYSKGNGRGVAPTGNDPIDDAGRMSCGGYWTKFILVLPGQSLQLRSQIVYTNGRNVLNWVVENPSEFVQLEEFPLYLINSDDPNDDYLYLISPSGAAFNPTDAPEATADIIMGHNVIRYANDGNTLIGLEPIIYGVR